MNETLSTGIYIRVSTEDQVKDGFSIHAQREKLTKYAEANDWNIYDYYIDNGISGKNLVDRPEVSRLLHDVEEKKVNNILIYKLDRLTRSVKDLIYLIELFEKYSCTFNSQTEKIDTSNAVGRMFIKIIGIFAEFERENLSERISFGYEQKTREGNYTNTNGVYGYDYIVGEQKLIVNEQEKKLVNRIFDLYINGWSYSKIAKLLNNENIPTKRGGNWAPSTIKSIINNPLYIGKVRYNVASKDKGFETNGNNISSIIDIKKWNLANSIVLTRKKYKVRRYPSEKSYYFHTIKCGKCGGNISAKQQIQQGRIYITYRCHNSYHGICESRGFSHKKVEECFLKYLSNFENMTIEESIIKNNNIKKLITNIKLNWENLTDREKQQFLERFVEKIEVIKEYKSLIIKNVKFKN